MNLGQALGLFKPLSSHLCHGLVLPTHSSHARDQIKHRKEAALGLLLGLSGKDKEGGQEGPPQEGGQLCPRVLRFPAGCAHTKPAADSSMAGCLHAQGQPWLQLEGSGGHGCLALDHWFSVGWTWPPQSTFGSSADIWGCPI